MTSSLGEAGASLRLAAPGFPEWVQP